jgi:hypothetical protein
MNIDEVKKRLDKFKKQNNNNSNDKAEYLASFWKPKVGQKSIARIVPYKYNKDWCFTELYFYFNIKVPRMIALTNFDESDPIMEFANELRKTNDEGNKDLAKKLYPKMRTFVPVIVRGEEEKGVRFWEFGKLVYQELLGVMADEDYGDITDITKGRDITVEVIPKAETGKLYDTTTVRVKPNTSALVDDTKLAETLLEDQKDIIEIFHRFTFDEMKANLQSWLKPDEEGETKEHTEPKGKEDLDTKLDKVFD